MAHESLAPNGSSPNSTPRRSRNKKNPYSDRGLDKFSALLTNLEEKRKKIYSQTDPENIVMVRFAYKNSDECVPVVVKQKDKKEEKQSDVSETKRSTIQKPADKKSIVQSRNLRRLLSKPCCYITAMVILILFLLSVFGKSVTILCTCVLWYLVPVLKQSSKRKEYRRILTAKKMNPDASSALSSPIRGHRKSF
ncbi:uncharacterized protein LOC111009368 [Momordica charantia]|uniref:Uncharacterized protein LOC111009368 n=1 Tax=Momordica charantia TaxID=3673 RepID=A0A6J1C965_MOMCH|nr:uncharacterized protein LOC111009368 [Momordica charantia]